MKVVDNLQQNLEIGKPSSEYFRKTAIVGAPTCINTLMFAYYYMYVCMIIQWLYWNICLEGQKLPQFLPPFEAPLHWQKGDSLISIISEGHIAHV